MIQAPAVALLLSAMAALATPARAISADEPKKPEEPVEAAKTGGMSQLIRDPADGQVDLSYFLEHPRAFLPVPLIITEPAVGYGLGGTALFFRPRTEAGAAGWARPNISAVGGLATENGTWAAFGGDMSRWLDGRLRTMVGAGVGKINLDFYGLEGVGASADTPIRYSLEFAGAVAQVDWQLAPKSPWSIGLRYVAADVQPILRDAPTFPGLENRTHVKVSAPTGLITFDTRDNIFTPGRGLYAETSYLVSRTALGSTQDFERFQQVLIGWQALGPEVTLGVRADYLASSIGTPFFLRPFIILRGVPAMRYQGDQVVSGEVEARWQFYQRWSVLGFVGTGKAETDRNHVANAESVTSGGIGFRYELARKFHLHAGLDLAFSPGTTVVLIQVGSAWGRP